jgi:hypothetical protein
MAENSAAKYGNDATVANQNRMSSVFGSFRLVKNG